MQILPDRRLFSMLWVLCLLALPWSLSAQSPANDNLAAARTLTGSGSTDTGSTGGATIEAGETAHAGYPASRSIWWTWTAPGNGEVILDLRGSHYGALTEVYTGKYINELVSIGSNVLGNDDGTGSLRFAVSSGMTYQIAWTPTPAG